MSDDILALLADRPARAGAIIRVCEEGLKRYIPQAVETLARLTEQEVAEVAPHLAALGAGAVLPLVRLLKSGREPLLTAVLAALGRIGDPRAVGPLLHFMSDHAADASAAWARDALICIGRPAVPGLLKAVKSPNARVRYHTIQALAWVGDGAARSNLIELRERDPSPKIREAAEEALHLIPCVAFEAYYQVYQGFLHPWLLPGEAIGPEWRVDVINIHKGAILWRFDLGPLVAAAGPKRYSIPCLAALFHGYEELGERGRELDLLILAGQMLDEDDHPEFYGVAVAGLSRTLQDEQTIRLFLGGVNARMRQLPGYKVPINYWLGRADLRPRYHLEHGAAIEYNPSASTAPNSRHRDTADRYGTGLTFTFARAVMDTAWVYRVNLKKYQEGGDFPHIPLQEKDPLRE